MTAYDLLLRLVQDYFVDLGYNNNYIEEYFSNRNFRSLLSICLANANVMIRNKTDRSSHQTHIAVTGEAIEFFYNYNDFLKMDNVTVEKRSLLISTDNLKALSNIHPYVSDAFKLDLVSGCATIGKRTQKQVQLSKKNAENSESFNKLRLGLYENDLLVLMKYRDSEDIFAMGIPQVFYLDYIPDYRLRYETNTYLKLPK